MTAWLTAHPILTYVIIYVFVAYVYIKVFKVRRLPILKEAIVYLLLGVGTFILLLFQHDLQLPIVQCLMVVASLMLIVKIRFWITDRFQKKNG